MGIYDKLRMAIYFSELLAALSGFLFWVKVRGEYWKWFSVYLLVIFATEITSEILFRLDGDVALNMWLNEYFSIPVQFLFFYWLFHHYFKKSAKSYYGVVCCLIYVIAKLADIFYFSKHVYWFLSFSYTIGTIELLVLAILFILKFVEEGDVLNFRYEMLFWVSVGLMIFYIGSFPFYGMYNTLAIKFPVLFNKYWIVSSCLNCSMYLLFAASFIWKKKKS